jgi:hypothetical protein
MAISHNNTKKRKYFGLTPPQLTTLKSLKNNTDFIIIPSDKNLGPTINRSLNLKHRIPIFYGMPKVHKTPLKLCPVVSCVNSFSSILSNWLDFKMKELLHKIPSYIKDLRMPQICTLTSMPLLA